MAFEIVYWIATLSWDYFIIEKYNKILYQYSIIGFALMYTEN